MPITIRRTAAGFEFLQTMVAPAIYFDHWAVRRFSEQQEIQERFVHALRRAGGTLLISLTNFGEFSAMTDRRQAIEAERFLDRVLPSLYIADFGADPGFLQAQGRLGPRPDNLIFRQMAEEWDANGHRLSTRTLITDSVDHRNIVQPAFEELKAGVAAAVKPQELKPRREMNSVSYCCRRTCSQFPYSSPCRHHPHVNRNGTRAPRPRKISRLSSHLSSEGSRGNPRHQCSTD